MNASVEGETLVMKRDVNLGCAVALGEGGLGGLIVPVIKNAGGLNLTGIGPVLAGSGRTRPQQETQAG